MTARERGGGHVHHAGESARDPTMISQRDVRRKPRAGRTAGANTLAIMAGSMRRHGPVLPVPSFTRSREGSRPMKPARREIDRVLRHIRDVGAGHHLVRAPGDGAQPIARIRTDVGTRARLEYRTTTAVGFFVSRRGPRVAPARKKGLATVQGLLVSWPRVVEFHVLV